MIKIYGDVMGAFIYFVDVEGVRVTASSSEELEFIKSVEEEIKRSLTLRALRNNPVVRAYRDFYWRIGVDPTKTRPAAEALVRRILQGRGLPKINNVVDAGNIVSARMLIPVGLYDLEMVRGDVVLRPSREDEVFHPIGGGEEKLPRGLPVLADEEKVVHLFPHRDSIYTAIRNSTSNVLVVACGVPGVNAALVRLTARRVSEAIVRFAGGRAGSIACTGVR